MNWLVAVGEASASKSSRIDLDFSSCNSNEDGGDNSANNVCHLIGMHQLFLDNGKCRVESN